MLRTYATVEGTIQLRLGARIFKSVAVVSELFSPHVLLIIRPVDVFELTVLGAFLFDVNLVVCFNYGSV